MGPYINDVGHGEGGGGDGGYNEFKIFLDVVRGAGREVAAVLDVSIFFTLQNPTNSMH